MEVRPFGLTSAELLSMVFQLAEGMEKPIRSTFNAVMGAAGKDRLYGFMKRNPTLSFRSPEPTSAARATGFNKVAVSRPKHLAPQAFVNIRWVYFSSEAQEGPKTN